MCALNISKRSSPNRLEAVLITGSVPLKKKGIILLSPAWWILQQYDLIKPIVLP